jgi:hypothetical protein
MDDPAMEMTAGRVTMGPVDHSAFGVPFILPVEFDPVLLSKTRNPRCNIYVVRHKKSLPRIKFDDKPLMPGPLFVIRQNRDHPAFSTDLDRHVRIAFFVKPGEKVTAFGRGVDVISVMQYQLSAMNSSISQRNECDQKQGGFLHFHRDSPAGHIVFVNMSGMALCPSNECKNFFMEIVPSFEPIRGFFAFLY